MADTAKNSIVLNLAKLVEEHNGEETVVLDISEQSSWTDFFIIATVNSQARMRGIIRYVNGYLSDLSIEPLHRHKHVSEDGWTLIDCGNFVIHLMTSEIREFYDLERLWYSGKVLYQSSKSS
ncbi:MAG: ribosome silencing factor [Spirochaetales bacterium]|jgi:ribosome-associated protein|nr:ribosome silencing factor [Spirochaetales bacterium]